MEFRSAWSAFGCACVIGLLAACGQAFGATRPATGPTANAEHPLATVVAVKGLVQVRDSEDQPWRIPEVGTIIPIGGECRTGPRSSIILTIPPKQVIILDRLGIVKILEALRGQDTFKTDLGMQYGRVRYEVEAAGLEHEAVIRSPSNALAIRGSYGELLDDGLSFTAKLYRGAASVNNPYHQTITMGTGPQGNYGNSPVVMTVNDVAPANNSENNTNPYHLTPSLTQNEQTAIVSNNNSTVTGSNGALTELRPRSGTQITTATTPKPIRGGPLSFELRWFGVGESGRLPDLDLFVTPPGGKTLIPGSTETKIPTGGVVSKNDHGGPNAAGGSESVTFTPSFPLGIYKYGVTYKGGTDPTIFKVQVLLNNRQVNANFFDTVTPLDPLVSFAIDITSKTGTGALPALASGKTVKKPAANRNSAPAAVRAVRPVKPSATKR